MEASFLVTLNGSREWRIPLFSGTVKL